MLTLFSLNHCLFNRAWIPFNFFADNSSVFADDIKDYFGETIGMYFGFLEFYSSALLLPSIVGLFYYALQLHKGTIIKKPSIIKIE